MKTVWMVLLFTLAASAVNAVTLEEIRHKSRPTKWNRIATINGPVGVRYYLGAMPKVLTEIVDSAGARSFYWGRWQGPGKVSVEEPIDLREALLLTGQLERTFDPPETLFAELE